MTDKEKREIAILRKQNYSYMQISNELNIPLNSVKTYCRRHKLGSAEIEKRNIPQINVGKCQCCGLKISQPEGRKVKKFCSDRCRNKWWNEHLDLVNRKANYEYSCFYCGKEFIAYGNSKRKYCCHSCYIQDRFGGES